jgi:hypothetical protein
MVKIRRAKSYISVRAFSRGGNLSTPLTNVPYCNDMVRSPDCVRLSALLLILLLAVTAPICEKYCARSTLLPGILYHWTHCNVIFFGVSTCYHYTVQVSVLETPFAELPAQKFPRISLRRRYNVTCEVGHTCKSSNSHYW